MKRYLNKINLRTPVEGNERRYELLRDVMKNGTFLPKTVEYEDIDADFKRWVEDEIEMVHDGKKYPTMVLYSNQRFTEYSQTWKYTDANKNIILNFKTITRENNPEYGKIHGGLWNIPGNRYYTMKKQPVLDDNGSESLLVLKMRVPLAVDMVYKVSIFTTNIEDINEFNMTILDRFKSRQAYIRPNGHYMPMTLESVTDKSSYQIDDRQFYSQTAQIKVMAYIIRPDDYKVEELALKRGMKFGQYLNRTKASVEIEEVDPCNPRERYNYVPSRIIINFPKCIKTVEFSELGQNFVITDVEKENISDFDIEINEKHVEKEFPIVIKNNENVMVHIKPKSPAFTSKLTLNGYDPDEAIDNMDEKSGKIGTEIEYEINADE